jgi:predicted CxxxxCH...CXXCH cytochrome family protein
VEILCDDCHDVPAELDDPGHLDGPPADLDFSPLAGSVSYDAESGECSDSYCHGAALFAGGSLTEPVWTAVGEDQAECGTCHGLPPARRHPQVDNCGACHRRVADNELNIVDPTLHINGRVDVN